MALADGFPGLIMLKVLSFLIILENDKNFVKEDYVLTNIYERIYHIKLENV